MEVKYDEYVVKNGDTLVGICKKRYNSLLKMKEICEINNIKNALALQVEEKKSKDDKK